MNRQTTGKANRVDYSMPAPIGSLQSVPVKSYHSRMGVHVRKWKVDKQGRQRYSIRWYSGKQRDIYLDRRGEPFTDEIKTQAIANKIALEIDEHKHHPETWLPEKRNKYAVPNAIRAYLDVKGKQNITNKQRQCIARYLGKLQTFCKANQIMDIKEIKGLELQQFFDGLTTYDRKTEKNRVYQYKTL